MIAAVEALAPVFLLIVLGRILASRHAVPDGFWPGAEKLTYYVFFPCLLFGSLAEADLALGEVAPMAGALAGAILLVAAALWLARPLIGGDGPGFTSVFQGAIRPNTYVGLAAAFGLFGDDGVTLLAIGMAANIPLANILAVIVLVRFAGSGRALGPRAVLLGIVTNPLIVAVALGIVANVIGLRLPPVASPLLDILAAAALPLGLLAVGAGLDLMAARRAGSRVALASAAKLLAVPAITGGLCLLFGVGGAALAVALLYNGLPTSASSYVLARQMGGDSALMAAIITATTLAAIVTIPLVVGLATRL